MATLHFTTAYMHNKEQQALVMCVYKHSMQVQDKEFTETKYTQSKWLISQIGHGEATG